jgi:hypothetical protein
MNMRSLSSHTKAELIDLYELKSFVKRICKNWAMNVCVL